MKENDGYNEDDIRDEDLMANGDGDESGEDEDAEGW